MKWYVQPSKTPSKNTLLRQTDTQTETQHEQKINNVQQQLSSNDLLPMLIQQMQTM